MTWRRFADAMPPEREGAQILVWKALYPVEIRTAFRIGVSDDPSGLLLWMDEEGASEIMAHTAKHWTHWQLIEPPVEEGV